MQNKLQITQAQNEILTASDGQQYIDLVGGFGAVLLGHNNQSIVGRIHRQLDEVSLTANLRAPVVEEARKAVVSCLSQPFQFLQFYSTGNEAVEFAMRMAVVATNRRAMVGFERNMHGKSIAASTMCWQNDFVELKNVYTLPFVNSSSESEILDGLRQKLLGRKIAAVFVELIQGTNGGHQASREFYRAVGDLCREYGSLCVVDEVLTGFYRAGSVSLSLEIGLVPDILIFGKAVGNGFPVAAIMCKPEIELTKSMLIGSTFSDNPLAASAVAATVAEMKRLDMSGLVANVGEIIRSEFESLKEHGVILRGRGALWVLELPGSNAAKEVQAVAQSANVLLSVHGQFVRLLPPATISPDKLHEALSIVNEACYKVLKA